MDLSEIRGQLDEVDAQIVQMFEKRMQLCEEVAEITDKYFDGSYLYRIMTGKNKNKTMKEGGVIQAFPPFSGI